MTDSDGFSQKHNSKVFSKKKNKYLMQFQGPLIYEIQKTRGEGRGTKFETFLLMIAHGFWEWVFF